MAFAHYVHKGGKRLRCGYTTGSCAALAAKAAALALLTGQMPEQAGILTPAGLEVVVDVVEHRAGDGWAACAVRKDAGDDYDITDGMLVWATVHLLEEPGVVVDGGEGIGRVTCPGLEQPVGAAAINRVPRRMIADAVAEVCTAHGHTGGIQVEISIPGGREAAAKTFNPRLGIEGGLSILGTSGIVEPQSLQALVDTIQVEMKMLAAQGHKRLILTPGNYGESFLKEHPPREPLPQVKCANFIGDTLDFALELGCEQIYLVGHLGKLVKVAAGIMNTHSRTADGRMETITAHAALCGADLQLIRQLMGAATTDRCLTLLEEQGLREPVMESLLAHAVEHIRRRTEHRVDCQLVLFSTQFGPLAYTAGAAELFNLEVR